MAIWSQGRKTTLDKPSGITDAYIFFTPNNVQKIPNASVFGISFFHENLDYWIDCEQAKDLWVETLKQPYPKIFRKALYRRKISEVENTYFVDLWLPSRGIESIWHTNYGNPQMLWVGTTIGVLLNLLVYMGYLNIHFVNCNVVGYENYALRIFLFEFAEIAKTHGITCVSHDEHSPLNNVMKYEPLKLTL